MAAIRMWVPFRDQPRIDELCPICFNPSLKTYTLQSVDLDGITLLATRHGCRDCNKFVGPAIPIQKEITQ